MPLAEIMVTSVDTASTHPGLSMPWTSPPLCSDVLRACPQRPWEFPSDSTAHLYQLALSCTEADAEELSCEKGLRLLVRRVLPCSRPLTRQS